MSRTITLERFRAWAGSFTGSALLLSLWTAVFAAAVWRADISSGDTAGYFARAREWAVNGHFLSVPAGMVYSPLYTVFYAWVQRLVPDVGAATAWQQTIVVFLSAVATLAALRQVLPRRWAWLTAAWWVAVNWDLRYEVHLFGYAVLAFGAALAGSGPAWWRRGGALTLLAMAAALVRNEFLPAVALFACCCAVAWLRQTPRAERWRAAGAFALPSVVAGLFFVWLFSGRPEQLQLGVLRRAMETRHRANMMQVYPFGYQQRHRDWTGDPFISGKALMERDFGKTDATFREAWQIAPGRVLEHIGWNLTLVPVGVQASLFGCYSGSATPDFAGVRPPGMPNPVGRSVLVALVWIGGAVLLWRNRARRWFPRGSAAPWTWLYLACCLPSVGVAIATQRPRAAYILPLGLLLLAYTALSARLLWQAARRRWRAPVALWRWAPIAVALLALALFPPALPPLRAAQPLLDDVHRLSGLPDFFKRKGRVFAANIYEAETLNCFLVSGRRRIWGTVYWNRVQDRLATGATLPAALAELGVTDLYLRHAGLPPFDRPPAAKLDLGPEWTRVAGSEDGAAGWEYWSRRDPEK